MKKAFPLQNFLILGLVTALAVGGFIYASSTAYGIGFPLDDAWIHQTYARSLASGDGWSFYPGQPSAGLTAPFWALILSLGHLVGIGPYWFTFILGWMILWGMALVGMQSWGYLSDKGKWWALGAGLVLGVEWHLVWSAVSGMETLLFGLLTLGGVLWLVRVAESSASKWDWLGIGALVGFTAWVRPEGITLLGPVGFVLLLAEIPVKEKIKKGMFVIIGFVSLFGPYLGFNRWLAGAWWPNTFYAKQAEYAVQRQIFPFWQRLLSEFSLPLVGVGVILLPGFIYMFYWAWKQRKWAFLAGGIWVIGFLSMYALHLPVTYQHGRYVMPVMPVYFLWGFAGLSRLVVTDPGARVKWILSQVWIFLVPAVLIGFLVLGAQSYSKDVGFINTEMVLVAEWLVENTGEDDLIAAHDIGAIGYFAQRPLLDLAGLVSPDVIPFIRDEDKLAEYMDQQEPIYFVTFPDWYPELVSQAELVYNTAEDSSPAFSGENMGVYIWP